MLRMQGKDFGRGGDMDVSAVEAIGAHHNPWEMVWSSPVAQSVALTAAFAGTNPAIVSNAPALAAALKNTVPDEAIGDVPTIGTEVDRYA